MRKDPTPAPGLLIPLESPPRLPFLYLFPHPRSFGKFEMDFLRKILFFVVWSQEAPVLVRTVRAYHKP